MKSNGPIDQTHRILLQVLSTKVVEHFGSGARIEKLVRLSGGASRETWAFDAVPASGENVPLILKRDPTAYAADDSLDINLDVGLGIDRITEGRLLEITGRAGVPAPKVHFYLHRNERTTDGLVMQRLDGETLGKRIVRDAAWAGAREKLAYQCGLAAGRFHSIPLSDLPELAVRGVDAELTRLQASLDQCNHPYPTFDYSLHWLRERTELAGNRRTLVHGDFRNGNIIVDATGLRAVLDWELATIGNPGLDLGWICARSWRYGNFAKPVGGFGEVDDLLSGYEAGGGEFSRDTLHYWELLATLRWGILCIDMGFAYIDGQHQSMEKATTGRRTAEVEFDLLQILDGK